MHSLFQTWRNRWLALSHDVIWVPLALWLAYWVRFNFEAIPSEQVPGIQLILWMALPLQACAYWYFGLYRGIWRFASIPDLLRILKAVMIGVWLTMLLVFIIQRLDGVPRSVLLLYPMFLFVGLAGPRLLYRWIKDHKLSLADEVKKNALIVGVGQAGEALARDLLKAGEYFPGGFVDDDPTRMGQEVHGVRVVGQVADLPVLIQSLSVDVVLIAIPSADATVIRTIVQYCTDAKVACRTLPSIAELAGGKVSVSRLRDIHIEDLLGRDPVSLDDAGLHHFLDEKVVLVTGAGGSIGSELCRQIAHYRPKSIIMLDHAEFNLYTVDQELQAKEAVAVLGDVRDEVRMRWLFSTYKPHIVFHAAAYKHVPLVEANPAEGVRTNVFGTQMVADLSVEFQAQHFILVSTDKAVNPSNVMGASKRAAEIYCQNLNGRCQTQFITTRFGNVLGSAGSVVPLFRKQIMEGGPITITHPEISRYFMTIPEAVSLILQAGSMGEGGEIFVLDMGEQVRIVDLADQMIRLSGMQTGRDIKIVFTGLRPGEKMYEELFRADEALGKTDHSKILLASSCAYDWQQLCNALQLLGAAALERDVEGLYMRLQQLVPEFSTTKTEMSRL
ncbi:MAG: nucleoside-diphosphate sugar epimerase/dehydratase [Mariprofundaceae bacterium]